MVVGLRTPGEDSEQGGDRQETTINGDSAHDSTVVPPWQPAECGALQLHITGRTVKTPLTLAKGVDVGDTLHVGEQLGIGQSLENGDIRLVMQTDGNLVLEQGGRPVWAAGTNGTGATKAILQPDGNFVVYAGDTDAKWATKTNGKGADHLTVQPDRDVVLYGNDGTALWSTGTHVDTPSGGNGNGAATRTYTVAAGDTLSSIAQQFYGDANRYPEIAAASGIANPDMIQPGQVLTIP